MPYGSLFFVFCVGHAFSFSFPAQLPAPPTSLVCLHVTLNYDLSPKCWHKVPSHCHSFGNFGLLFSQGRELVRSRDDLICDHES